MTGDLATTWSKVKVWVRGSFVSCGLARVHMIPYSAVCLGNCRQHFLQQSSLRKLLNWPNYYSEFVKQPRAETDKEFMLSLHKLHIEASLDKEVNRSIVFLLVFVFINYKFFFQPVCEHQSNQALCKANPSFMSVSLY